MFPLYTYLHIETHKKLTFFYRQVLVEMISTQFSNIFYLYSIFNYFLSFIYVFFTELPAEEGE